MNLIPKQDRYAVVVFLCPQISLA